MTMVLRNQNKSLIPVSAAVAVGTEIVRNNKQYFWNGINWLGRKAWAKFHSGQLSKVQLPVATRRNPVGNLLAAPVATTRQIRGSRPKFQNVRGQVSVSHREYIQQMNGVGTGVFTVNAGQAANTYAIAPINVNVFPWLLSIARNFDQYKLTKLTFHYVPLCATTEIGRIALFYDKDSGDAGPTDRSELANYQHLAESPPWAPIELDIPLDSVYRFVNDSNVTDRKLVDTGRFGFAVYGTASGNALGDIFVSYTIQLKEPQPSALIVQEIAGFQLAQSTTMGPSYGAFSSAGGGNFVLNNWDSGNYLVTAILGGVTSAGPASSSNPAQLTIDSQSTAIISATRAIVVMSIRVNAPGNNLSIPYVGTLQSWNVFNAPGTRELNITA